MLVPISKLEPGYRIPHLMKQVVFEKVRSFSSCMGRAIHTDAEFAKGVAQPNVIAQALMSHNYMIEMLVRAFGRDFLENGKIDAKFLDQVFPGDNLFIRGEVTSKKQETDGWHVALDVWCERMWGQKTAIGTATVLLRRTE
ncbi:MAG: MaoC family dehydratase [Dehalococcoidales bacterium]|nr:MaoC family dehydratase [Dehalococcoidales bacterium]